MLTYFEEAGTMGSVDQSTLMIVFVTPIAAVIIGLIASAVLVRGN